MEGCEIEEITLYKFNGRHYKSLHGARMARVHKKLVDLTPAADYNIELAIARPPASKEALEVSYKRIKEITNGSIF